MKDGETQSSSSVQGSSGALASYVDTVGNNSKKIQEYIKNQLEEDKISEQLELELWDPFTGKKNR